MSETIPIKGGFLRLVETDFNCPSCGEIHHEEDYYKALCKNKSGVTYRKCKGCKTALGISSNIMGDVVVWRKDEEIILK